MLPVFCEMIPVSGVKTALPTIAITNSGGAQTLNRGLHSLWQGVPGPRIRDLGKHGPQPAGHIDP